MSDVTQILGQIEEGDGKAAVQLLPLVYDELRTLAAQRMGKETPGQILQATDLVHEGDLPLVAPKQPRKWHGQGHFLLLRPNRCGEYS